MKIITELVPNNKFRIKTFRIADGYGKKRNSGDDSQTKNTVRVAKIIQELDDRRAILRDYDNVAWNTIQEKHFIESTLPIGCKPPEISYVTSNTRVGYCKIPDNITYADVSGAGIPSVVTESYEQFGWHNRRLLDLLEKSQQQDASHSNWGVKQSPKVFRYQAGDKIKEGGAIIDRFCGSANSSMLTLTVPGSTWYALDAIARWSGWLVNRILQVIRRIPSSEPPVYWFFVWEHQKRGALHLHFCLGWDVEPWRRKELGVAIKDKWFQCLLSLLEKDNVDCFQRKGFGRTWRNEPSKWQWDYQDIKKSVAAYFAKYCQKNSEYNGLVEKDNCMDASGKSRFSRKAPSRKDIHYPSRYWGSSQSIKIWAKRLSVKTTLEAYSQEEIDTICHRLRTWLLSKAVISSVSVNRFEVIDENNGVCISSGEVETYCIEPSSYPYFWAEVYSEVFERDSSELAWMQEFLATSVFASMQDSIDSIHARKSSLLHRRRKVLS